MMHVSTKIFIALSVCAVVCVIWFGMSLAPGSYPYAKVYEFAIPEDSLIRIIEEFKAENPELDMTHQVALPDGSLHCLEGGRNGSSDYWYNFYFYYPDKDQIVFTWTRPKTRTSTSFALVSWHHGLTLGNWVDVNKDFWWWEKDPAIAEFEQKILAGIREKVERKNESMNRTH